MLPTRSLVVRVFDFCPWKTSSDLKAVTCDEVPSCCWSKGVCGLFATASGRTGIGGFDHQCRKWRTTSIILCALYGLGTNRLPGGSSSFFGAL
jgi:hypothetical protein